MISASLVIMFGAAAFVIGGFLGIVFTGLSWFLGIRYHLKAGVPFYIGMGNKFRIVGKWQEYDRDTEEWNTVRSNVL